MGPKNLLCTSFTNKQITIINIEKTEKKTEKGRKRLTLKKFNNFQKNKYSFKKEHQSST